MLKKLYKKIIKLTLIFIALILSCYSFSYSQSLTVRAEETPIIKNVEESKEDPITLDFYKLKYKNEDIIGSLEIEDTKINTLLVQYSDNEYYLSHSIEKKKNNVGSIFVDYRVNLDSKQVNIYGHNSNYYDVMFKDLEKYTKKSYYEKHKYIKLWDGTNYSIYEIFSVQILTSNFEYFNVNPKDWQKHMDELNKSIYNTGLKATKDDKILSLQTCYYNPMN